MPTVVWLQAILEQLGGRLGEEQEVHPLRLSFLSFEQCSSATKQDEAFVCTSCAGHCQMLEMLWTMHVRYNSEDCVELKAKAGGHLPDLVHPRVAVIDDVVLIAGHLLLPTCRRPTL